MNEASALESALKRDRLLVLVGLAGATVLAWTYLVVLALRMGDLPSTMGEAVAATQIRPWSGLDFALMFLMWTVMMIGMMLPSAAPMILTFAAVNRRQKERGGPFVPTLVFVSGYAAIWTAFSAVATGLQWALDQAALLSPMMVTTSPRLGGALLIAAGVFQWTPLKQACLRHCRSPFGFILHRWRRGARGAWFMGLEHGAFCLGCCWALMGLLFFGGVMSLLWIAAIALFVLVEKAAPAGSGIGRASGLLLVAAGAFVLAEG